MLHYVFECEIRPLCSKYVTGMLAALLLQVTLWVKYDGQWERNSAFCQFSILKLILYGTGHHTSLKLLNDHSDFLIVATVSLDRWQYHIWFKYGRNWCVYLKEQAMIEFLVAESQRPASVHKRLLKAYCKCVFYITNEMQLTQCSLLLSALYMFRAVFPPIVRGL
jgi:hypothetical protein